MNEPIPTYAELIEACEWMDKALGLAAAEHAALRPLIPNPDSLTVTLRFKWQKVIDAIVACANHADSRLNVRALAIRQSTWQQAKKTSAGLSEN
jgi:hypothetical protein